MTVINRGVLDGVRRVAAKVRDLAIDGGLPGAPLGYRLRGATMSGPPASGTWQAGDVVPDRSGTIWICLVGGTPGTWTPDAQSVTITTTGSTFSPFVQLAAGSTATVSWVLPGGTVVTGLTPAISFGSAATRQVRMIVADGNGDALSQVQVFSIGYINTYDQSKNSPSSSYNWPVQPVSGLANINAMTGLLLFLADNVTTLTGTLDFSGMQWLTNIECGNTGVQAVNLDGCTSLVRLLLEAGNLTALNVNPLAFSALQEIRVAIQSGGELTFTPAVTAFGQLWHFCVRDQQAYSIPNIGTMFPVMQELLIWNSQQYGALKPSSKVLTDVDAHVNWFATADFTNLFPFGTPNAGIDLHANQLTSVTLTGCGGLQYITLNNNPFTQAAVNGILATVDSWGTSGVTLNLQNTAAPTGGTGNAHVTSLQGRGWTVTVDSSGAAGGGFGSLFTYGESAIARHGPNNAQTLPVNLVTAVNSGDLLVAALEATAAPKVNDTAGNTWTILGPYNGDTYLAYCLSSAASASGLTVTAWSTSGYIHCAAVSRFVPHGVVSFGAVASSAPSAGGIGQNPGYNLGNLGTVPANSLAWGAFTADSSGAQIYSSGFQSGSGGTPDFVGAALQGPDGTACILYVPGCANANAALTWTGTGTGAAGVAVSAYFTST